MRLNNDRGYTLTELIVVMGIFLAIMLITSNAFKTIITTSSRESKSVETQIAGILGLELLRADLEQAGFGLPWEDRTDDSDPNYAKVGSFYEEATNSVSSPTTFWFTDKNPRNPASFNDAQASPSSGNAPRAVLSGETTFNKDGNGIGSNYLVIKSMVAGANDTSKKWTMYSYDKNIDKIPIRTWGSTPLDFTATEQVVVLRNSLPKEKSKQTRQLMTTADGHFSAPFSNYSTVDHYWSTHKNALTSTPEAGDSRVIYGIDPATTPRMPFNRADYYIMRPSGNMPKSCAENTGFLYKSTVLHSSGELSPGTPLLGCVADMQVVYGLDTSGSGTVNAYIDSNDITRITGTRDTTLDSAKSIRTMVKEIRVYILAQEGQRDRLYTYPSQTVMVGEKLHGVEKGRTFNLNDLLGPNYKYYRWKVYTIVVRPKNLVQ